jgi:DNA damage-binding protein 1
LQDTYATRNVKTYEIDMETRQMADGPWVQHSVDAGASILIPVPAPTGVRRVLPFAVSTA